MKRADVKAPPKSLRILVAVVVEWINLGDLLKGEEILAIIALSRGYQRSLMPASAPRLDLSDLFHVVRIRFQTPEKPIHESEYLGFFESKDLGISFHVGVGILLEIGSQIILGQPCVAISSDLIVFQEIETSVLVAVASVMRLM